MRTSWLAAVIGIATLASAVAGCSTSDRPAARSTATAGTMTVDELDRALAAGAAHAVDANGAATRRKLGTIPGAVLLSDYAEFAPTELPADRARPLVFYCANEQCGASHEAAAKAITAGYRDVKVLPEGIAGWVKAGKRTQAI